MNECLEDPDGFVERYQNLVYHVLNQMGLPYDDVEDLFVEVFVRLLEDDCRRVAQWNGRSRFTTFLGVVVRNVAYDYIKAQTRRLAQSLDEVLETAALPDPAPDVEALVVLREVTAQGLSALSEKDRRLLNLKYYEECSTQEIAYLLGIPVEHIAVGVYQAKRKLRKELIGSFPELVTEEKR